MKTLNLFWMAFVAVTMSMNFTSCSNEDVINVEEPKEEYVTVGLGCTGEYLEFSESVMGRNATEELYGIQVYALTAGHTYEDINGETQVWYDKTPYAYGLFTSLNDVKIRLLQGHLYDFEVSIVMNPFKEDDDLWFGEFYNTYFNNNGSEFVYSTSGINLTIIDTRGYNQYDYERFFGVLEKYTPKENGSVEVNTKRVCYGVKYEVTGLGDSESLTVEVNNIGGGSYLYKVELDSEGSDEIYTFSEIYSAWEELYSDADTMEPIYQRHERSKKLTISWKKADGSIVPLGTYTVTFKRNVKTTIRITAENLNMDNGIKVYKEEAAMTDDENIYEIEGGKVTEVPVTSGN